MIGGDGSFGPVVDYSKQFARDYVDAVTAHFLDDYHIDGFRYDEVTDLYDGPTGVQYASFAYSVYGRSLHIPGSALAADAWQGSTAVSPRSPRRSTGRRRSCGRRTPRPPGRTTCSARPRTWPAAAT